MQERLAAETTEAAKPPAAPVAHGSPVMVRMLALQRGAGNRAVTRMLAREPVAEKAPDLAPTRFVFILGPKDDAALKSAEAYYTSAPARSTRTTRCCTPSPRTTRRRRSDS